MTLIPIGRALVSDDARPLGRDDVVDAVLAVKHSRETPSQALLDALRAVGPMAVDLVVVGREWIDGRPALDFEVEDYESLENVPQQLYRYADTPDGVWWSGSIRRMARGLRTSRAADHLDGRLRTARRARGHQVQIRRDLRAD